MSVHIYGAHILRRGFNTFLKDLYENHSKELHRFKKKPPILNAFFSPYAFMAFARTLSTSVPPFLFFAFQLHLIFILGEIIEIKERPNKDPTYSIIISADFGLIFNIAAQAPDPALLRMMSSIWGRGQEEEEDLVTFCLIEPPPTFPSTLSFFIQ